MLQEFFRSWRGDFLGSAARQRLLAIAAEFDLSGAPFPLNRAGVDFQLMTRLQVLALAMAGIVVSGIGLFLGTAFAMPALGLNVYGSCLLYTSDAADE